MRKALSDMSIYDEIDRVLTPWAKAHEVNVLIDLFGRMVRFFYVSAGQSESYQVVIEVHGGKNIKLWIYSVETDDDAEFSVHWIISIAELESALDYVWIIISEISARTRMI